MYSETDDEFWAAFDEAEAEAARRPLPWYRRTARWVALLFVAGMLATSALLPWGRWFDHLDSIEDPAEIVAVANEIVAESPYGWMVSDVQVRAIPSLGVAGFVHSSPADGIITLDYAVWDPDDLRSTVAHEIGHLVDFAAWGEAAERRDGLASEVWAECAAVDAGFRQTDRDGADQVYRCTATDLEHYRFAMSRLGQACAPWIGECRPIAPYPTP